MQPGSRGADPALLRLIAVSKSFGSVRAVDGVDLEVQAGEVLTLLGPSGCGKTTTLRMVTGLEHCDSGQIIYDGRMVDAPGAHVFLPTHKRNMGMVFQSYAIWPHMTVFDNVAYPLHVRRWEKRAIAEAVDRTLELVGLTGFAARPATALSGGQQQRVALARSLVFEPRILLLDEPFSNLDAKLREHTRAELKVLQRRLGITVLLVTHDQIEALSLSDRIAVMRNGTVEQIGTPQGLYRSPATPHVREFLGRTITLSGRVEADLGDGRLAVRLDGHNERVICRPPTTDVPVGGPCFIAIRPESVEVDAGASTGPQNTLTGSLEALLFMGDRYEARVDLGAGRSALVLLPAVDAWREGQTVSLSVPENAVQFWAA